jgi:para-nitrobenzyl esterase
MGAFHGSELPYVFHSIPARLKPDPEDEQLSEQMMGYWTRFARTGDPNGEGAFQWPAYDAEGERYLILNAPLSVGQHLRQEWCDFREGLR